jgi:hypothetical protein
MFNGKKENPKMIQTCSEDTIKLKKRFYERRILWEF